MTDIEFKKLQECAYKIGMDVIRKDGLYRLVDVGEQTPHFISADPFQVAVEIGKITITDPIRTEIPY